MNPNNKPYTAEQIRTYLSGKMTDAEMRALEKAALSDPLLADAIEGYQLVNQENTYTSLDELKKNIAGHTAGNSGRTRQRYLPMAAALALICMLAATGYLLLDNKRGKNTETAIAENRVSDNTPVAANTETNNDSAIAGNRSAETEKTIENKGTEALVVRPAAPEPITVQKDVATKATENSKSDNAVVPAEDNRQNTALAEASNPTYQADVASGTTPSKQAATAKAEAPRPAEQEDQSVVTVTTAKQRSKENAVVVEKKQVLNAPTEAPDSAEPLIGRAAYEQYLSKSIALPQGIRNKYRGRSVILAFSIRRNGKITEIRVVESLSPECDAEAIRLLKSGPAWASGKGSMTVNF